MVVLTGKTSYKSLLFIANPSSVSAAWQMAPYIEAVSAQPQSDPMVCTSLELQITCAAHLYKTIIRCCEIRSGNLIIVW